MKRTRMPPSPCPSCGQVLDGAGDPWGLHRPKPGDFTVCIYCGAGLRYDRQMQLKVATDAEVRRHAPADFERYRGFVARVIEQGKADGTFPKRGRGHA
jgi:hypothetical protein